MNKLRIVARLDIKNEHLIKSIHLEGLRKIGNPEDYALQYYNEGIDEILISDVVASLYQRDSIIKFINSISKNIFVPICVGGGIRTIKDAQKLLDNGADKIFINTAAVKNPKFITDLSHTYGKSTVVVSIEAKKISKKWIAFIKNGRESTGLNVLDWGKKVEKMGAGEILLTSIDKEGTQKGFDLELIKEMQKQIKIPLIVSGGMGKLEDLKKLVLLEPSAISIASVLHYKKIKVHEIKRYIKKKLKIDIRYEK